MSNVFVFTEIPTDAHFVHPQRSYFQVQTLARLVIKNPVREQNGTVPKTLVRGHGLLMFVKQKATCSQFTTHLEFHDSIDSYFERNTAANLHHLLESP